MNITKLLSETLHSPVQIVAATERKPLADQAPVAPFGIYYPAAWQQDVLLSRGTPVQNLLNAANDTLTDFADFASGSVYAIVQETWEVGTDGHPHRTDTQMTTAFADCESAWLMIEDDAESRMDRAASGEA